MVRVGRPAGGCDRTWHVVLGKARRLGHVWRAGAMLTLRTASMTLSSFEHHSHAPARGACAISLASRAFFHLATIRVSKDSRRSLIAPQPAEQTAERTFNFNMSVIFVWPQPCLAVAFVGSSSAAAAAAPSACHRIADVLTCGPAQVGPQSLSPCRSDRQVFGSAPPEQLRRTPG